MVVLWLLCRRIPAAFWHPIRMLWGVIPENSAFALVPYCGFGVLSSKVPATRRHPCGGFGGLCLRISATSWHHLRCFWINSGYDLTPLLWFCGARPWNSGYVLAPRWLRGVVPTNSGYVLAPVLWICGVIPQIPAAACHPIRWFWGGIPDNSGYVLTTQR